MNAENETPGTEARGAKRRKYPVTCLARAGSAAWFSASLIDLSTTGFQVVWPAHYPVKDRVSIRLPGLEVSIAEIRWRDGNRLGCRFQRPLSEYVVDHLLAQAARG